MPRIIATCLLFLCAAVAQAGPEDAVVRFASHGGSGTVIATGEGYTLVLSCWHCFANPAERARPIAIDLPHFAAGTPKKVGIKLLALGDKEIDLSLIKIDYGPWPYVAPVAAVGYQPGGACLSVGYDKMELTDGKCRPTVRPAKIVAYERNTAYTDASPYHGRSGGALINGPFLIGVVSAYESDLGYNAERARQLGKHEYRPGRRGMYVSLPAIQRFLVKAGAAEGPLPDMGAPNPLVQPGPGRPWPGSQSPQPWPGSGNCPGGVCPSPYFRR